MIRLPRYFFPLIFTLLLIPFWGRPPVFDARGVSSVYQLTLYLPVLYLAFSPVARVLDSLSILSTAQSVAVFVSVALILLGWIVATQSRASQALWKRASIGLGVLLVVLAAIEAAVVFLPRPMAQLRVSDPEFVLVDFHSHTGASHDVRKSFTAESNRAWHRGGGFDVAYVTDHVKFAGAVAARARNPRLAGDGTSLLGGVEGRYHKIMSTIMLGLTERDTALLNKRGNLLPGKTASGIPPVTIVALPNRNLDSVTVESLDSLPRFAAIELVDAAPRGLAQLDREEAKVQALAIRLGLVPVAASNNHGWGRTVAAWNLMRIPGWRMLAPDSVGRLIEEKLRERDPQSVTIVRRLRPTVHGPSVAGTLPVMLYQIVASLTLLERAVWLAWLWSLVLVSGIRRRRS